MPKPAAGPTQQADAAVKTAERAIKAAADALSAIAADQQLESFELLPFLSVSVSRLGSATSDAVSRIEELRRSADSTADERRDTYGERLRSALVEAGLRIEGSSSSIVIEGRVFLAFDSRTGVLQLNDETVSDLRITSVLKSVKDRLALLVKCATPPEDFGRMLASASDSEIATSGKQAGAQVRVDCIHRLLMLARQSKTFNSSFKASLYREYTPEMFRSDLYVLLADRSSVPDGRVVHVDSGAEAGGALWMFVPALGRTGFVGRLRLVPAN